MGRQLCVRALAIAATLLSGTVASAESPLALESARISLAGTSNIHAYTATTTTVRVVRAEVTAVPGADFWEQALKPGAVQAFEIAIPAATLSSPKDGLNKNMHKALKVQQHADITFRLLRFETPDPAGPTRAVGVLRIAGVEREVAFELKTERKGLALALNGAVELLMTDYGIAPPKAMLGMLRTDPKVKVSFEVVLAVATT